MIRLLRRLGLVAVVAASIAAAVACTVMLLRALTVRVIVMSCARSQETTRMYSAIGTLKRSA